MMSRQSALVLTEEQHIAQSLGDIATTPMGSRLFRREYGTNLVDLIDQPVNEVLILKCYSSLYSAFTRWENRIEIIQIQVVEVIKGGLVFDITAIRKTTNNSINFKIPVVIGAVA